MFVKLQLLLILLFCISCSTDSRRLSLDPSVEKSNEEIYHKAQVLFNKKQYFESLELFKNYIEHNKKSKSKRISKQVFWAIDQIGRIYLRFEKSPEKAILFFEDIKQSVSLDDAQLDTISEWVAVSKEWKKLGRMPSRVTSAAELFQLGEMYFNNGMEKLSFPNDDSGNVDFYIAATYLVPYVNNFDKEKNIGKALYMLGNIRYRSWNDLEYKTENFYLKELIRRLPHTELAEMAYRSLEDGVRLGYTGSGGDHTPYSQIEMLKTFKILAYRNTKKNTKKNIR